MIFRCWLSILLISISLQAAEPVVVHLKPPCLKSSDIVVSACCDRPRRADGVNISLAHVDNKLIVHCYGHGGFGFTTLFGSINEALSLLMQEKLDPKTPLRIIGSGCMGLTMAIELYRKGFTCITISTKEKYNIPSWRAGGFFDPGVGKEVTEEEKHRLNLGLMTYATLHEIEQGTHPYLSKDIVCRLPIYYPADIDCAVEILEQLNFMPQSELVTLDFGNGIVHKNFKKQLTYFINVTELMNQLWLHIEQLHIPVVYEEIKTFSECSESVICNCTGLGAQLLNQDSTMIPTCGHFFMLKAQSNYELLDYLLFTKVVQNDKKEMIYFFPKHAFRDATGELQECAGMVGGTFIPHAGVDEVTRKKLDEIEFAKLMERAQLFFYGNTKF